MRNPPKSKKTSTCGGSQSAHRRHLVVPGTSSGYSHKITPKNEVRHEDEAESLEKALYESAVELIKSKGYKVTRSTATGLNPVISRCVEVPDNRYIIDIVPLEFHYEGGTARYNNESGCLQVMEGETDNVNELCDKLVEETEKITSILLKGEKHGERSASDSYSSFVEGLEGYSVNLLLSRINYFKLDGKIVRFWVSPVLLTSSRLEDETGELTPWVPIPAKPTKRGIDVVNTANLASYLDFREREVRSIGGHLVTSQEDFEIFPKALRLFRILTFCAAITVLGGFFILALDQSNDSLLPVSTLGLAALIEALGGRTLLKGYRRIRKNSTMTQAGFPMITPEEVDKAEEEFLPDERTFLYWKYSGTKLPKLRNETRRQRINDLVTKSREILGRTDKLENDELFSEAVLSYDRATRTALSAILPSVGVETQGRDIETWFPHLRRTLQNMKLEDIRYLRQLRDRVNKGYDASREEAQRAKQIAAPVISDALQYLKTHRGGDNAESANNINDHPTRITEDLGPRIPDQILNASRSVRSILNASDREEPSNLGPAGQDLIKAKEKLMLNSIKRESKRSVRLIDIPETTGATRATPVTSAKVSDELDNITKSLTEARTDTEEGRDNETDLLKWASAENSALPQVLPFENLGDFRRVTSRRKSPIVASFLSDDEPSMEVKSAMDNLVTKYHTKAAFIYVSSKSQDIARECKIKSYPTILVFHKGRVATELKSLNLEQIDRELSKMLGTIAPASNDEDGEKKPLLPKNGEVNSAETNRDDEMRKLGVTH